MFYQPSIDAVQSHDSSLYYHDGLHYLFVQYRSPRQKTPGLDGIALATSADGVHFEEAGPIVTKRDDAEALGGITRIWKAGERYLLNFQERRNGIQEIFFAESRDLIHWTRLGDEYRLSPDPRWYDDTPAGRWDDLWVLPIDGGGFRGYLTARPWNRIQGIAFESIGMAESEDGRRWHALPPPELDWGEWPPMSIGEVAGVEKIGERYYLVQHYAEHMLGNRQVREHLGRTEGMYVFTADCPDGPFRPDTGGYRLPQEQPVFTRFYRAKGELLINHKITARCGPEPRTWMPPLKKAVVDENGHLRQEYWDGNDAVKGRPIAIDLRACTICGIPSYRNEAAHAWRMALNRLEANEPNSGGVALLENRFDLDRGIIFEGTMTMFEPPKRWGGIGMFVEEESEKRTGTAVLAQTRGRTELGPFRASGLTLVLPYPTFTPDEIVDTGIEPGIQTRFRLLIRKCMFELYLNDVLIQCYSPPKEPTGTIGLIVESGRAVFEQLAVWEMNL